MFCPECGMYNDNENLFCVKCGNRLNIKPVESDAAEPEPVADEPIIETYDIPDTKADLEDVNHEDVPENNIRDIKKSVSGVKDYFARAILSAVLGSIVFGTAAIIFSGLTQSEKQVGNVKKAKIFSEKTRLFCFFALALGIVKYVFIFLLILSSYILNMF